MGAVVLLQEFSLTAAVSLPILMLSDEHCVMGVVHLGKSSSSSFSISNNSISKAVWTTEISEGTLYLFLCVL